MDLSEFLLARIAEDETTAREALARASVYGNREVAWHWLRAVNGSSMWEPTNHSPARVLAECDAKWRIVEQHDGTHECPKDGDSSGWWDGEPCDVLRLLALPYADHPDYRQEWAALARL